jgi:hypothetical protein
MEWANKQRASGLPGLAAAKGAALVMLAGLSLCVARPVAALVVDPFFPGSQTTTLKYPDASVVFPPSGSYPFGAIYISSDGYIDDGGNLGGGAPGTATSWGFFTGDGIQAIAPLWNAIDLSKGGQITYGSPTPGAFAVSWVNVHNRADPSVVNTFQVVLIGGSGFTTNTGLAIAPGSIVFGYGNGVNGTVNLNANSPATIGIVLNGLPLQTLAPLGIGDANGVVTKDDVPIELLVIA